MFNDKSKRDKSAIQIWGNSRKVSIAVCNGSEVSWPENLSKTSTFVQRPAGQERCRAIPEERLLSCNSMINQEAFLCLMSTLLQKSKSKSLLM